MSSQTDDKMTESELITAKTLVEKLSHSPVFQNKEKMVEGNISSNIENDTVSATLLKCTETFPLQDINSVNDVFSNLQGSNSSSVHPNSPRVVKKSKELKLAELKAITDSINSDITMLEKRVTKSGADMPDHENLAKHPEYNYPLTKALTIQVDEPSTLKNQEYSNKETSVNRETTQTSSSSVHVESSHNDEHNLMNSKAMPQVEENIKNTDISGIIRKEMMKLLPDIFKQFQDSISGTQVNQEKVVIPSRTDNSHIIDSSKTAIHHSQNEIGFRSPSQYMASSSAKFQTPARTVNPPSQDLNGSTKNDNNTDFRLQLLPKKVPQIAPQIPVSRVSPKMAVLKSLSVDKKLDATVDDVMKKIKKHNMPIKRKENKQKYNPVLPSLPAKSSGVLTTPTTNQPINNKQVFYIPKEQFDVLNNNSNLRFVSTAIQSGNKVPAYIEISPQQPKMLDSLPTTQGFISDNIQKNTLLPTQSKSAFNLHQQKQANVPKNSLQINTAPKPTVLPISTGSSSTAPTSKQAPLVKKPLIGSNKWELQFEKIITRKVSEGKVFYKVRWHLCTWESEEDLLVSEYSDHVHQYPVKSNTSSKDDVTKARKLPPLDASVEPIMKLKEHPKDKKVEQLSKAYEVAESLAFMRDVHNERQKVPEMKFDVDFRATVSNGETQVDQDDDCMEIRESKELDNIHEDSYQEDSSIGLSSDDDDSHTTESQLSPKDIIQKIDNFERELLMLPSDHLKFDPNITEKLTLTDGIPVSVKKYVKINPIVLSTTPTTKTPMKEFDLASTVLARKERRNKTQEMLKECEFCSTKLAASDLAKHHRMHSKNTCHICSKRICNKKKLIKHMEEHSRNVFQCHSCFKVFTEKEAFETHANICDKTFKKSPSPLHYRKHVIRKRVHKFVCKLCCRKFDSRKLLRYHKMKQCPKRARKDKFAQCAVCSKEFSESGNLIKHLRLHKIRMEECLECGEYLEDDMATLHNCTGEAKFKFTYTYKQRMTSIASRINALKKLKSRETRALNSCYLSLGCCTVCKGGFKKRSLLYDHINYSSCSFLKYRNECLLCSLKFNSAQQLVRHVASCFKGNINSLLKPQTKKKSEKSSTVNKLSYCSRCALIFPSLFTYKLHIANKHLKVKQQLADEGYTCHKCYFKCYNPRLLSKHIEMNLCKTITSFPCFLCEEKRVLYARFGSLASLLAHLKDHYESSEELSLSSQYSVAANQKLDVVCIVNEKGKEKLINIDPKDIASLENKLGICEIHGFGHYELQLHGEWPNRFFTATKLTVDDHVLLTHDSKNDISFTVRDQSVSSNAMTLMKKSSHYSNKHFSCFKCNEWFSTEKDMTFHMRFLHKLRFVSLSRCSKCSITFDNQLDLVTHKKNCAGGLYSRGSTNEKNDSNDCTCGDCIAKKSASEKQIEKLAQACYCQQCKLSFTCRHALEMHRGLAHPSLKVFACDICDSPFLKISTLIKHYENVHEVREIEPNMITTVSINERCSLCHTVMKDIRWHLRSHLDLLYECYFCNSKISNKQRLIKHVNQKHNHDWTMLDEKWTLKLQKENARDILVDIYGMKYRRTLNDSLAPESKCNNCGMVFFHPTSLEIHENSKCCTTSTTIKHKKPQKVLFKPIPTLKKKDKSQNFPPLASQNTTSVALTPNTVVNQGKNSISKPQEIVNVENTSKANTKSEMIASKKKKLKKVVSDENPTASPVVVATKENQSSKKDGNKSSVSIVELVTTKIDNQSTSVALNNDKKMATVAKSTENKTSILCGHCDITFENEEEYLEHMKKFERASECTLCGAVLASKSQCLRHIHASHSISKFFPTNFLCKSVDISEEKFDCAHCHLSFNDQYCYYKHVFSHFNVAFEKCHICKASFTTMDCLADHIRQMHRAFFCKCCYKTFHSFEALHYHSQLHVIEVSIPRDAMGKMVIQIDPQPLESNISAPLFQQFSYSPVFYMTKSVPKSIIEDQRLFYCHVCYKNIEGELTFIVHLKTHAEPRRLRCVICTCTFEESDQLKKHLAAHFSETNSIQLETNELCDDETQEEPDDVTKCNICSQVFDDKTELRLHEAGLKTADFKKEHFHYTNIVRRYYIVNSKKTDTIDRKALRLDWSIALENRLEHILSYFSAMKATHPVALIPNTKLTTYVCQFCYMVLALSNVKDHLLKHISYLTNTKTVRCSVCPGVIPRNNVLEHMEISHSKHVVTRCQCTCQFCYVSVSWENLEGHMLKHQQDLPVFSPYIFCYYCNKLCTKQELLTHMQKYCRNSPSPKPVVSKSAVSKPVVSKPVVSKSAVSKPAVSKSAVSKHVVSKSAVSKPAVSKPVVSKPAVSKSVVSKSAVSKSAVSKPAAPKAKIAQPIIDEKQTPGKKKDDNFSKTQPILKKRIKVTPIKDSPLLPKGDEEVKKSKAKTTKKMQDSTLSSKKTSKPDTSQSKITTPSTISAVVSQPIETLQQPTENGVSLMADVLFRWLSDCKKMTCSLCHLEFSTLNQLKNHLSRHLNYPPDADKLSDPRYAVCLYCQAVTRTGSMRNHINIKHKKEHAAFQEQMLRSNSLDKDIPVSTPTVNSSDSNASIIAKKKGFENIIVTESPKQDSSYQFYCHFCFRGFFRSSQYLLHCTTRHPHLVEAERQRLQLQGILKRAGAKRKNSGSPSKTLSKSDLTATSPGRKIIRPGNPPMSFKLQGHNTEAELKSLPVQRVDTPLKRDRSKFNAIISSLKKKKREIKPAKLQRKSPKASQEETPSPKPIKINGNISTPKKSESMNSVEESTSAGEDESPGQLESSDIIEETEEEIIESSSDEESNVPRLSCRKCKAAFDDEIALNSHMNSAHPVSSSHFALPFPFVCLFCGSGHNQRSSLKKHIISKHPDLYTKDLELNDAFRGKLISQELPKRDRSKFKEVISSLKRKNVKTTHEGNVAHPTKASKKISPVRLKFGNNSKTTKQLNKIKKEISTGQFKKSMVKATKVVKKPPESLSNSEEENSSHSSEDETSPEVLSTSSSNESLNESDISEANTSDSSSDDEIDDDDNAKNSFICKYCDAILTKRVSLKNHEKRHFKGLKKSSNELLCFCCHDSIIRHELKWHMHQKHANDKNVILSRSKLYCPKCTYTAKTEKYMDEHISSCHSDMLQIECRFCDERFPTQEHYNQHYVNIHEKRMEVSSRTCFLCNKSFSSLQEMFHHYSIIHMKKKESAFCHVCDKYFYNEDHVKEHNVKYHDTDIYTCFFCASEFEEEALCSEHVLTHNVETEHQCARCNGYFISQLSLEQHTNMYENRCDVCRVAFSQSTLLLQHKSEAECEKLSGYVISTFRCKPCNISFNRLAVMKKHMLDIHQGGVL